MAAWNFAGFLVFLVLIIAVLRVRHAPDEIQQPVAKVLGCDIGEGLAIAKHGVYGVDMVRCGRARLQKMKRGPFTFGCFNELVLDDLFVVLPHKPAEGMPVKQGGMLSTKDVLSNLGVSEKALVLQNLPVKFSGLRINRLSLAKLDAATNVVPVLVARSAEAVRRGLKMQGCDIINGNTTNKVGEATLLMGDAFVVNWKTGKIEL